MDFEVSNKPTKKHCLTIFYVLMKKTYGNVNGCGCANGPKHQEKMKRTKQPNQPLKKYLIILYTINTKDGKYTEKGNIPISFMQTDVYEKNPWD